MTDIREAIALCLEVEGQPPGNLEFIGIQRVIEDLKIAARSSGIDDDQHGPAMSFAARHYRAALRSRASAHQTRLRSIRTSDDDDIAVRVPHPALPMIRRRVAMTRHDHFDVHFSGTLHDRLKIVHLEP
jgi:hypothetical protein